MPLPKLPDFIITGDCMSQMDVIPNPDVPGEVRIRCPSCQAESTYRLIGGEHQEGLFAHERDCAWLAEYHRPRPQG